VAEVIDRLDGTVVANDVALRITNGDPASLVRGTVTQDPPARDRFAQGDLEYLDDERDIVLANGDVRRFVVHRGFVRDRSADPIALVVVAQAAPVAA
jgi:hypothetical protein